jgi:hypothetical protein
MLPLLKHRPDSEFAGQKLIDSGLVHKQHHDVSFRSRHFVWDIPLQVLSLGGPTHGASSHIAAYCIAQTSLLLSGYLEEELLVEDRCENLRSKISKIPLCHGLRYRALVMLELHW